MKKLLLISGVLSVVFLAGCNAHPSVEKKEVNSNAVSGTEASDVPVIEITDSGMKVEGMGEAVETSITTGEVTPTQQKNVPAEKIQKDTAPVDEVASTQMQQETPDLDKGGVYAPLAKCLTKKGVRMYGAYWCPHCADQKEMFGEDFRFVNYIECDPKGENNDAPRCQRDKIDSYPTWYFPATGYDSHGTKPLEKVAAMAGCDSYLPQ